MPNQMISKTDKAATISSIFFSRSILTYQLFGCLMFILATSCNEAGNDRGQEPSEYLQAVQTFADNVMEKGEDRWGDYHSPLLVDGIEVETGEPIRWEQDTGEEWIISNFASQQNLMRVFTTLTELTGEPVYRERAEEITNYMFEQHSDSVGLLHWGGHQFVDLETMEHQFEGRPHELKNHFPYYEFLYEVDPEATAQMLRAMWNGHVMDWEILDLNRHAPYNTPMGSLWDHEFVQPEPFFEGRGLTFINFGTDMIHVGMSLYFLEQEEGARIWGQRLFEQYVRARHPETGLGVYQYSQPERREQPPQEGPLEGRQTYSNYGDRAENQFKEKYGDIALEGNVLWGNRVRTLYGRSPIMTLHLAEQLEGTQAGEDILTWTLDGMRAAAKYAYVPEENYFRPMWTDGTDLSDDVMPRTGYYGDQGDEFDKMIPGGIMALSYARAARLSEGDPEIWNVIRHILMAEDLGDPGSGIEAEPSLNLQTDQSDPDILVAVLELHRATGHDEYLQLAGRIGDNILENHFHNGYFQPSSEHNYARFDDPEPLALLVLEATLQGRPEAAPPYVAGIGGTQGDHHADYGRTRDWQIFEETE